MILRMQAARLQPLKFQIAVASPDPQARAFLSVRSFPRKLGHPNTTGIDCRPYEFRRPPLTTHNNNNTNNILRTTT